VTDNPFFLLDPQAREWPVDTIKPRDALHRIKALKGWAIHGKRLVKAFEFEDFSEGLDFVNKVGEVAEKLDHHPDVHLTYRGVLLEITTRSVGGLTEKDFRLAAAIDSIR
jgi:4a-hydroxytetrahydrobiopterin dehydratase